MLQLCMIKFVQHVYFITSNVQFLKSHNQTWFRLSDTNFSGEPPGRCENPWYFKPWYVFYIDILLGVGDDIYICRLHREVINYKAKIVFSVLYQEWNGLRSGWLYKAFFYETRCTKSKTNSISPVNLLWIFKETTLSKNDNMGCKRTTPAVRCFWMCLFGTDGEEARRAQRRIHRVAWWVARLFSGVIGWFSLGIFISWKLLLKIKHPSLPSGLLMLGIHQKFYCRNYPLHFFVYRGALTQKSKYCLILVAHQASRSNEGDNFSNLFYCFICKITFVNFLEYFFQKSRVYVF